MSFWRRFLTAATPLNAILGWAQMCALVCLDAGTAAHALETIERTLRHKAELIGDFADGFPIISGKLQLNVIRSSSAAH